MYAIQVRPGRILVLAVAFGFFGSGILADPKAHTTAGYVTGGVLMAIALLLAFVGFRYVWWSLKLLFTGRGPAR